MYPDQTQKGQGVEFAAKICFMASDICKLLLFQTNRGLDMMADNIRARSATQCSIFYLVPTVFG